MTLHLGGTPESIYWNGPASEVYLGSDLVWSAETLAHSTAVPSTVVEYYNWSGLEFFTEPPGPGSVYRVVPDITYTPNASLVLEIQHRHTKPDPFRQAGSQSFADTAITITAGETEALVSLYPGDRFRLLGYIPGPGTSTIAGSVELYRRGDATPLPPLFPASGSRLLNALVTELTTFTPQEGHYLYAQEPGTYRVTVDLPENHNDLMYANILLDNVWRSAALAPPHPAGKLRYQAEHPVSTMDTIYNRITPGVSLQPGAAPLPATIDWLVEKL